MYDYEKKLFDDYNGEHQITQEDAEAEAWDRFEESMYQKWEDER